MIEKKDNINLNEHLLNLKFIDACFNGHLDILQYLIFDVNIEKTEKLQEYLNENPNLEVENMFELRKINKKLNKELKKINLIKKLKYDRKKDNINLNKYLLNLKFIDACSKTNLETVEYLLSSPNLKEHADIHTDNDAAFRFACSSGHIELVKLLLRSPKLKEYADIHVYNDSGFRNACFNGHFDILQFLIFDMDIEKTDFIKQYLKENNNEKVENMFELRQINKKLNKDLKENNLNKKIKI